MRIIANDTEASVAEPESLAEKVYEHLKADILAMRLKPGQPLVENEIAKSFNISRTPVREALKRLEAEGLTASHHGRGAQVSEVTMHDVLEAFVVRELLEPYAAGMAAAHMNEELRQEIELLLNSLIKDPRASGELLDRIQLDLDMHDLILRAAGNETLRSIVRNMYFRTWRTYPILQRFEETASEHRFILEAIMSGDQDAAEERMRKHIQGLRVGFVEKPFIQT